MTELKLDVRLRVAGGWVRDKLLRANSQDIDIALDTLMGEAFAAHLCAYMRQHCLEPRGVGVIQSNPDKSKHLETATIRIFGQEVDFVNLRAEEYASGSRIPERVAFGTPVQDALRRDMTINAMFYHIQDETIEDWTGHGLLDLEQGSIRTPLAAETTLLDDPLRLLRIIRFAARYNYALVPDILEASRRSAVHQAFRAKVSRERVGIEFDKTISHPNGFKGLGLYAHLEAFSLLVMEETVHDYTGLLGIFRENVLPHLTDANRRIALLCLPFVPFAGLAKDPLAGMIQKALKLPNKDMHEAIKILKSMAQISEAACTGRLDPVALGRLLRQAGPNWREAALLASVHHAFVSEGAVDSGASLVLHQQFIAAVERLSLEEAHCMATLLTGKEIQQLLQIKEGREVGVALAALLDWQCANPQASKHEAELFIMGRKT